MTCLTKKQKFSVENPDVIRLANGRYAFRCKCPWEGKNGKELYAFKFCSYKDWEAFVQQKQCDQNDEEEE